MSFDVDVLIVGAGPAGLTAACELVRRGLTVRIIDQLDRPTTQSRALGIQARTLETFEKVGVIDAILDRGLPIQSINIYEDGKRIGHFGFSGLPSPYPFILSLPQSETENILNAHLQKLGVRVERPVTLIHLQQQKAIISFPNGNQEVIRPRWVIGCDGAHSTVRHLLDLTFKGAKFPEGFGLADIFIESPLNSREIHGFLSRKGIAAIFPLPPKNQVRLIASFPTGFNEKALTLEYLQNLIRERTSHPIKIQNLIWTSIFFVHRRIAPKLRVGSIFLCGDAAHIHSPVGGQGLNISVQDAFNLAWKLALVHKNEAPDSLLDTYQEERMPTAKKTLRGTTIGTFFLTSPHFWIQKSFFKIISCLVKLPSFQRKLTLAISELSTKYRFSSIVSQPWKDFFWRGPRPGTRAPLLEDPTETRHILLIFGAPAFQPALPNTAFRHFELDSPTALAYKATSPCLYLIRPDGYIGYRSRTLIISYSDILCSL